MLASSATSFGSFGSKSWRPTPSQTTSGVTPGPEMATGSDCRSPVDVAPPSRCVGNEPVAERSIRVPRDEAVLAVPACPVRGVEPVEVEHATVRVERVARRREPVDREPAKRQPAEQVVPAPAIAPVLPDVELRQRAAPVGHAELPGAVAGLPRRESEVRLVPMPALERPVRAVTRCAGGDEKRKLWAAVRPARVAELLPDRLALGPPPAGVVDTELRLHHRLVRSARVQRARHEHALEPTLTVVRQQCRALGGDGEPLRRRVARDQL